MGMRAHGMHMMEGHGGMPFGGRHLSHLLDEAKATFLLFSNGKIVCTGTKSEKEVHAALDKLIINLKKVK